jgi:hypothetical protein
VLDLKRLVASTAGVSVGAQALTLQGRLLGDDFCSLADCGVRAYDTLTLSSGRLKGGFYYAIPFVTVVGFVWATTFSFVLGSQLGGQHRLALPSESSVFKNDSQGRICRVAPGPSAGWHRQTVNDHIDGMYGGFNSGMLAGVAVWYGLDKGLIPRVLPRDPSAVIKDWSSFFSNVGPRVVGRSAAFVFACAAAGYTRGWVASRQAQADFEEEQKNPVKKPDPRRW